MSNVRPLTPRQEDRRHRILSATRAMVADHGYEGMVMSQVAEAAGVSPTTLYNLYNTKDELLLEALRDLVVDNYQKVDGLSDGPGWRYLLRVVDNGAWLRSSEPAYGEAITDTLLRSTPGDAMVELLMNSVRQDFHYSLKKMSERGELRDDVDIQHLSTILLGNYWSTFMLLNKGVEKISRIRVSLQVNLLSLLISASIGQAKADMESTLAELRAEETPAAE